VRRLKRKNIKRFKRFKPQTFQASSFKTDPVRQLADHQGNAFVKMANYVPATFS